MTPLEPVEHRREPRYRRLLPVQIGNLELMTANVSLRGMQIVCPIMSFIGIEADVRRGQFSAQVTLPRGAPLGAALSVRYCSQHGDEVLVGVQLALNDLNAQAQWADYIDELSDGPSNHAGESRQVLR